MEGFNDFDILDIEELFGDEEISDADLVDLELHQFLEDTGDRRAVDDNNAHENIIVEGFRLDRVLQTYFLDVDRNTDRALKFYKAIKNAVS